jgi:hypothetical protein
MSKKFGTGKAGKRRRNHHLYTGKDRRYVSAHRTVILAGSADWLGAQLPVQAHCFPGMVRGLPKFDDFAL